MSEHAVTVLITRKVRAGCEAGFERIAQDMVQVASGFRGYLGAQLVHSGEDPDIDDPLHHVVLAFDSERNLHFWRDSPQRKLGLAAAEPFIDGEMGFKSMTGLGLWYRTPTPTPPRWKVAVVTWLGICPTVYLLFLAVGDSMKTWWLFPRTALLTFAVVLLMTWVVAPRLTKLFKPWLFKEG
ncbi:antibiotic biosynthesis monooxygenase [Acidovorax sp. D2M1]|uniref:Antibiotic biosynthesis monooxygenase n=1 Tax=Acidovorax benzenivorans TaxID=2987520 RepID=A0ABT5RUF2_9BURK|nr:antibiotic biosynthesis monooxygenase [Acidovorax benzenivorans]MDD2177332.1 antibiotic biosynthesis monooxygenase [Acidovorax benzenivorans]